jgi:putative toxin-antitoxin system antitoxin component (TIGR02293 family)
LLDALIQGFPADVLSALREAGLPHSVFEQVVAPRRTLMRRKAEGQRLTRAESDAAWRLANVFALATRVLNGRKAAIDWLTRAKPTFANRTPIDLLETSVGAAHVNRMLQRLEWGDVA